MALREVNTHHSRDGVRVLNKDGEEAGPGSSSLVQVGNNQDGEDRSRVGSKVLRLAKVFLVRIRSC